MSTNAFDERIADQRARLEQERTSLDKLKLAWEIVSKERRSASPSVDQTLNDLRKTYNHISETLKGQST